MWRSGAMPAPYKSTMITYADKDQDAALGTLERQWTADDANQVKDQVNALFDLVGSIKVGGTQYEATAVTAEDSKTINHDFGRYPVVVIRDTAGKQVEADVTHTDTSNVTVLFSEDFTGTIILM